MKYLFYTACLGLVGYGIYKLYNYYVSKKIVQDVLGAGKQVAWTTPGSSGWAAADEKVGFEDTAEHADRWTMGYFQEQPFSGMVSPGPRFV